LVIGSFYIVEKLGLVVWLFIVAAHFFYHLGLIVSVPVGLVGAVIGTIWVFLMVLARKLTWFGLKGLLWALARMG
jgi:hypothetical protein